jgi:hypothetical protein
LRIDGIVSADSTVIQGAAGSINIFTMSMSGNGIIRANAGAGSYAGAGGRIAIGHLRGCTNTFTNLPPLGIYINRETVSSSVTVKGGNTPGVDGDDDGSICIYQRSPGTMFMTR